MDNNEVVIIGAGICGLATALALHKKGIKSVVMERSESLRNTTGAAIGIRQNGWRALDQLGIADIFRQTAMPIQGEYIVSLGKGKRQDISIHGELRCVKRKDLVNTLYDALPPGTVNFGCQLESIKSDPNTTKTVLRFSDGSSIIAKVVIGCDGGKSVVADFLNLKPTKVFPLCGVQGLTNYPNGHSFNYVFARFQNNNTHVGRLPMNENLVYWFCAQPYVPKVESICEDPEVIVRSTLELLSDHPQEIQEMIKDADKNSLSFTHLRYRTPWDLLTGTFSKGTITIAGDANHVMGPFLGQGGSAALEDAVVLARNLGQTGLTRVEGGKRVTVEEAFSLFVKQRRMRVVRLSVQTYLTGVLMGASSWLKKFMCIVLLVLLFPNTNDHIDYDCGVL